jgi:hypothetical protein
VKLRREDLGGIFGDQDAVDARLAMNLHRREAGGIRVGAARMRM